MACNRFYQSLTRANGLLPAWVTQGCLQQHAAHCPDCRIVLRRVTRLEALAASALLGPELQSLARARSPRPARESTAPLFLRLGAAGLAVGALALFATPRRLTTEGTAERVSPAPTRRESPFGGQPTPPTNAAAPSGEKEAITRKWVPAPEREAARPDREEARDDGYLDGWDPGLTERWSGQRGLAEWQRRLPKMRDDFVQVPLPQVAGGNPGPAIRKYEQEAAVVDTRLTRNVTLQAKDTPLSSLCETLRKQTGVSLYASQGVADENVTAFLKDRPAHEVMREVARLLGFKWARSGEGGAYTYELVQELKAQLAEEELRNRDRHAAALVLDERMQRYRPFLGLPRQQIQARLDRATGQEKQDLQMMAGKGWGPIQMYFRLTPQQQLTLLSGKTLTFSSRPGPNQIPLPADLRRPVLESTGFSLGSFQGKAAIVDGMFGEAQTPLADLPDAYAEITLTAGRSELGQLKLHCSALGFIESKPDLQLMYMAGFPDLAAAISPSVEKPQNAVINAKHRTLPELKKTVSFKPAPSCPWFNAGGKIEDRDGFEIRMGDRVMHIGPGGMEQAATPHVTSGDVWQSIHEATGLPIVADSYSRVHAAGSVAQSGKSIFDALCTASDQMGVRWQKDGAYILGRSTGYFWDKLKEVPQRHLARWRQSRMRNGTLPLDDVLEMATLADVQLDSTTVGFAIGHCWNLEEWGMVGTGGAFRLGLPGGGYMRRYARFLATLGPGQRAQALGAGLGIGDLSPAQRQGLIALLVGSPADAPMLEGLRFRVGYAPVGTYMWFPSAPTQREAEELNKRLGLVTGPTAEATLAAARRLLPSAEASQVRRSRGTFSISFTNARGDAWQEGAPGAAFSIN
jgi:hypothetical protein